MGLGLLIGVVVASWVSTILVGMLFNKLEAGEMTEYRKTVADQSNNTLFWGIGGIVGIFIGGAIGGVGKYIVFGLCSVILLIDFIPYLVSLFMTAVISLKQKGQGLYWLVLLSKTICEACLLFIVYRMFQLFFIA